LKKRGHPLLRRILALVCALATLWAVVITVGTDSLTGAWQAMRTSNLAQILLKWELGDWTGSGLSTAAALSLYQSPLLLAGRTAVAQIRAQEEQEDPPADSPQPEQPAATPTPEPSVDAPAAVADNGITGRTITASGSSGYDVVNDVYIKNTSIRAIDAAALSTGYSTLCPTEGPQVLIVHTHGSEAYTQPPGEEYVASGTCRTLDDSKSVVKVGDEIAAVLSARGLSVLHDRTMHDNPEYNGAYTRSLASIEDYKANYPSLLYILDIHRDAIEDSDGNQYKVVCAEEPSAAQISLVVGTDGSGYTHDNWQENLKLALAVQRTAWLSYPTLMRPIYVRNSRYNQQVTTGSLLVEVGAAGNSLAEAINGGRLFAKAFADTVLGA
jgi:stage II sporulation protein P